MEPGAGERKCEGVRQCEMCRHMVMVTLMQRECLTGVSCVCVWVGGCVCVKGKCVGVFVN